MRLVGRSDRQEGRQAGREDRTSSVRSGLLVQRVRWDIGARYIRGRTCVSPCFGGSTRRPRRPAACRWWCRPVPHHINRSRVRTPIDRSHLTYVRDVFCCHGSPDIEMRMATMCANCVLYVALSCTVFATSFPPSWRPPCMIIWYHARMLVGQSTVRRMFGTHSQFDLLLLSLSVLHITYYKSFVLTFS